MIKMLKEISKSHLILCAIMGCLSHTLLKPSSKLIVSINLGDSRLVAVDMFIYCISGFVVSWLWNNYSDKLYKKRSLSILIESMYIVVIQLMFIFGVITFKEMYFASTASYVLFNINSKIWNRMTIKVNENPVARDKYDNHFNLGLSVAGVLGSGLAMLINIESAYVLYLALTVVELMRLVYGLYLFKIYP